MTIPPSANDIASALSAVLPDDYHAYIPTLAQYLFTRADDLSTQPTFPSQLTSNANLELLLQRLAGQSVPVKDSILNFGQGNQFGNVTVKDIAGNDILNINLTIYTSSNSYTPQKYMLLGLCALAQAPLTITDLQQLAPDTFRRRVDLLEAAREAGPDIIGDGSDYHGYTFRDNQHRAAYLNNRLTERERNEFQQRFVSWGQIWYANRKVPLPKYLCRFWLSHLAEMGQFDETVWVIASTVLTELISVNGLTEQPWASARFTIEGNYSGYLSDLDLLWRWAELQHDLVLGLRCALLKNTFATPHEPALASIVITEGAPAEILAALVPYLSGEYKAEVSSIALDFAQTIADDWSYAEVLTALVPYLDPSERAMACTEALTSAHAIEDDPSLVRLLIQLAPHLTKRQGYHALMLTDQIRKRLKDASRNEQFTRADEQLTCAIALLPPKIPTLRQALRQAFKIITTVVSIIICFVVIFVIWSLKVVLPLLIVTVLRSFVSVIIYLLLILLFIPIIELFRWVFMELKSLLNNYRRTFREYTSLSRTFQWCTIQSNNLKSKRDHIARNISDVYMDNWEQLKSDPFSNPWHIYHTATSFTKKYVVSGLRAFFSKITMMINHIVTSIHICRDQKRFDEINTIADTTQRIVNLADFLNSAPPHWRKSISPQDVLAACSIADEQIRAECLVRFAPCLSGKLLQDVVEAICSITNEECRAASLTILAPQIPYNLLPHILTLLRNTKNDIRRTQALHALADRFGSWTKSEASDHHFNLVCDYWQENVRMLSAHIRPDFLTRLAALAPWLVTLVDSGELEEITATIYEMADYRPVA